MVLWCFGRSSPVEAARRLFYLERGSLALVLRELAVATHPESTLPAPHRERLREQLLAPLLPKVAVSLATATVALTKSIADLTGEQRSFLQDQRLVLGEVPTQFVLGFEHCLVASGG